MKTKMTARDILAMGVQKIIDNPELDTITNVMNLRLAAGLKWQEEEMGGLEHLQFAYRNNSPIVPPEHECHPTQLVKRGFIDGHGWSKKTEPKIRLFKWPDGNHWYASVDDKEVYEYVGEKCFRKWNTAQQAENAAKRFIEKREQLPLR